MIDFEHVKEQIDTLHKRIYVLKDMYCGEDEKALCVYICNSLENVYTAITNLNGMTKTKIKYAIGQTVWRLNKEDYRDLKKHRGDPYVLEEIFRKIDK